MHLGSFHNLIVEKVKDERAFFFIPLPDRNNLLHGLTLFEQSKKSLKSPDHWANVKRTTLVSHTQDYLCIWCFKAMHEINERLNAPTSSEMFARPRVRKLDVNFSESLHSLEFADHLTLHDWTKLHLCICCLHEIVLKPRGTNPMRITVKEQDSISRMI